MKPALTLIILTYNEALHIERCIRSAAGLNARIVVVDSFSKDDTVKLAEGLGAEVFQNPFVNQAAQFQWAMEQCQVESEWVLRLDADETIDKELTDNINAFIAQDGRGYNGAVFNRKHIFLGRWVRHGGRYPLAMLRLFRNGCGAVELRWMDEHIVLHKGKSCMLAGGFEDNNLNPVSWFIDKHNKYASREMVDIMLGKLYPADVPEKMAETSFSVRLKRFLKQRVYLAAPYFVRPCLYFTYRYIFQLGFLDGARGFAYHFMQGLWYRALVDLKCMEVERAWQECDSVKEKHQVLEKLSGYSLEER